MTMFVGNHKKQNGVYYTPEKLADYLISNINKFEVLSILDPSCGEGSLLKSAFKTYAMRRKEVKLVGCDIENVIASKDRKNIEFNNCDYFSYSTHNKFNLIVANPPYVKYHLLSQEDRKKLYSYACKEHGIAMSSKPDLWVFFLLKSLKHITEGGCIAAILPKSFLHAKYALFLRRLFSENFANIRFLSLGKGYFDDVQERVVLLWLEGYGKKNISIEGAYSEQYNDNICYKRLEVNEWESSYLHHGYTNDASEAFIEYKNDYNFKPLVDFANISIGVVTGANDYFLKKKQVLKDIGFCEKDCELILRNCGELKGLCFNGNVPDHYLLKNFNAKNKRHNRYVVQGVKDLVDQRKHSLNRKKWYLVDSGKVPDAFFPYRATNLPVMVMNNKGYQCTNSIHRLNFNGLGNVQKKWIQISMLSDIGQLSIEYYSKIYGNGVLKTEPGSLKNVLVYGGSKRISERKYQEIHDNLIKGNKKKAALLANEYIVKQLAISRESADKAKLLLEKLRRRRLNGKYELVFGGMKIGHN